MLSFTESLFIYLQSGFPVIAVETVELDRAAKEIEKVVQDFNKWLPTASNADEYLLTNGLLCYRWNPHSGWSLGAETIEGTAMVQAALDYILSPTSKPAVYLMDNFHLQWNDALRKPIYLAQIRKIFNIGKQLNKHLIFLSPTPDIPSEIRDLTVVIEFKLPTKSDIFNFIKAEVTEKGCTIKAKDIEEASEAASGMTLNETENALSVALALSAGKRIKKETIFEEKAKSVKRSGLLEIIPTEYGLEAVGGLANLKIWASKIGKAFNDRAKAEKYGLPMPKGCLCTGVSGSGKSLLAKALAKEFNVPLFRLDVGKLFGSLVGSTEANTREFFKLAEALAPCTILVDEIEKVFAGLESSGASDSGVTSRLIGSFLYFMQEKTIPAYFVATANSVTSLPPEMLRAGRWDKLWFVDLPNQQERIEIFKIHIEKTKRRADSFYPLDRLATASENFTGAEIENVIKTAMFNAFYEGREYTTNDILDAIKVVVPIFKLKKEEIASLRAWAKDRAETANAAISMPTLKSKRAVYLQK